MTERYAIQAPVDLSEWQRVDLTPEEESQVIDFNEGQEEEGVGGILDAEKLMRLAEMQDPPLSEDDQLKAELLRQNHEEHFEAPDPSDALSDAELWELMPESIRGVASE